MEEQYYEALLNIKTNDQKGFSQSLHYHRYEATPYSGLEQLRKRYEFKRSDRVVDFGCGKARTIFYLHHFCHTSGIGIEMDEKLYKAAMNNKASYVKKNSQAQHELELTCCLAEDYQIQTEDSIFYFFNPFSVQVFMKVINNILLSVENYKRKVDIILYYPSTDYIFYLENQTAFELVDEIKLMPLYEKNKNERFLIYRLRMEECSCK
ncbi:SAM-dependent methyltransferase [Caldibacillus lycopersici]|uniref:SAM-dependent methyltransferase n=1 Tax=Perspicuibacillus lycopersici TaxID=1325689 RepID=A0AAE3IYY6_9BACI|nr:SAM-dependent methyltransferase [Perspicuibacillus lycopersici]MCU9614625.1 SAM-dependent methyltransferase [Perspicuibacillus lycopersici]